MAVRDVAAEVVLQYMDTSSRLRFSVDNPGFRQIEKSYPLNIKTLQLKDKSFNIDGMEFDGAGNFHYDTEEVIQEGWKSLMEMVFSGRGNFLKIQKLVVHPRFENPSENLKLNVQNLVLVPWMDFRAVRDLISEKSLPLKSVEAHLSCYRRHKIFDTAGILKLTVGTNDHPEVMVANPRVHFNCKDGFAVPIAIALFYKYHPDIERNFTFNVRGDRDWIWILRDFGNDQLRRQWLEIEHQDNIQMYFPYKSDSGVLLDFTFNRVPTSFHPDGRFKSRKYHQICISINPKNMALSRVGQEVVLQYMDINSRLRFSACNPAFREFERCYPLHIKNLRLYDKGFQIDDTFYRLGIHRTYEKQTPDMVKKNNHKGGVQHDTGMFERSYDYKELEKGPSESDLMEMEEMKKRREEIREAAKGNWELSEERRHLKRLINIINERGAISKLKFEDVVLLTIWGKGQVKELMVNYTKPLQEVFKDLMGRIFNSRDNHIHVGNLKVDFRFKNPLDFVEMQVKNLNVDCSTNMSNYIDLISTNSIPLETARHYLNRYEDHKLFATAKLLIIEEAGSDNWSQFKKWNISNPRVLFKCANCHRSALEVALYFKEENPAIKRHYTFEVSKTNGEWYDIFRKFADWETRQDFIMKRFALPATFTIKTDAGADLKISADKKDDSIVTIDLELIP